VVIGNQVLKLQPFSQLQGQKITKTASGQMMITNCDTNKVEITGNAVNQGKKIITSTATSTGGNQQIIFGSNFKVLKVCTKQKCSIMNLKMKITPTEHDKNITTAANPSHNDENRAHSVDDAEWTTNSNTASQLSRNQDAPGHQSDSAR
jgi:hypothetical protein